MTDQQPVPDEAKLTVDKRLSIIRSVTIEFRQGTREYTKELCRLFEIAATEKAVAYIRETEVEALEQQRDGLSTLLATSNAKLAEFRKEIQSLKERLYASS